MRIVSAARSWGAMDQQAAGLTGSSEDLRIALTFDEFFEMERGRLFEPCLPARRFSVNLGL